MLVSCFDFFPPKVIHPGTSMSEQLVQIKSVFLVSGCSPVARNEPRVFFLKCRNVLAG